MVPSAMLVVCFVAALLLPSSASAQDGRTVDQGTMSSVVDRLADVLERRYVFPDVGERYARGIRESAGEYAAPMSASEFAGRLTADLQSIQADLHLRVFPAPGGAEPDAGDPGQEAAPVAATAEQLFTPFDLAMLPDVGRSLFADEASRNHFFRAVEVLPGNVGYIDYDQFGFPNFSTDAADAAFGFVAETSALILDLRGNRGGVEGMNQYLASHFFGDEPVHLYSRYYGTSRTTLDYHTFPGEVAHRFPDLPLYILVDPATGSAAENLTFALQGLDRAVVVGEATAGAAHSSRAMGLADGFMLQIPIARAFNPRTDEDWEGTGVLPDVAAHSSDALEAAHTAAVDALLETASAETRIGLEDAKLLMAARDADPADAASPEDYEGQFGQRRVFVEEGRIRMVRTDVQGAPAVDLVPLAPDYFTLQQAAVARIRFERDAAGRVVRLHVRLPTGDWETGERR
ncbi:MAG: S41 family peptidase [Gemmatimonadota bacterium]